MHRMSLKTILDHKDRILRALKYIDAHMDGCLSVSTVAEVACLSRYHFHRRFAYYLGITLCDYVRWLRLTQAANTLTESDLKVTDVAFSMGYETAESFTKAFRRRFGTPPTVFRKSQSIKRINRPQKMSAILLKPCSEKITQPNSGRQAYGQIAGLTAQSQLDDLVSFWVSVFPDIQSNPSGEAATLARTRFGEIRYALHMLKDYDFKILKSGASAVFSKDGEHMVFKPVKDVMPYSNQKRLSQNPQFPFRLRSIMLMPCCVS